MQYTRISMISIGMTVAALAAAMAAPAKSVEQKAHVHGQASLQMTIEGQTLRVALESPLESFTGFERAPRDDKDRATVRTMAQQLRAAERQFVPSLKAGCTLAQVELESDVLDRQLLSSAPGAASPAKSATKNAAKEGSGHADLDATFLFRCAWPEELHELQVNLFDAFPRLQQIDVQVAGPKRQAGERLTSDSRKISW